MSWRALTGAALDLDFANNRYTGAPSLELLTNGTFATDIAGWTAFGVGGGSAAGVTWDPSGKLSILGTGSGSTGAQQAITTIPGVMYDMTATCTLQNINLIANNTLGNIINPVGGGSIFAGATTTHRFTATQTTTYITLYRQGAVTSLLDNVTVKEVNAPISRILTTSRATAGMAQHTDGRWESFAANIPRITTKGLLVEEARTNLLFYSEDLANAWWVKTTSNATAAPVTTSNYATAPDGTLTAARVQLTLPGDTEWALVRRQSIAIAASTSYVPSVFVRATDASQVGKKVTAGVFDAAGGAGFLAHATVTLTTAWQRLVPSAAALSIVASTAFEFFIGKHRSSGIGTTDAEAATDFLVWGAQLELGTFVTSPIRTAGATATRNADIITAPVSSLTAQSTMFVDLDLPQVNGTIPWRVFEIYDGANSIALRTNGSGLWTSTQNVDGSIGAGPTITTGRHKIAGAYFSNDVSVSFDGAAPLGDTTATILSAPTRFDLGNSQLSTPRQMNGYLVRIASWSTRLTDANLIRLTLGLDVDPATWAFATATIDMDFALDRYAGQHKNQLSVARASPAMAQDSAGAWTTFAANVARITDKGLLLEEARTNALRNNTMVGAVAGDGVSVGTVPTNWSSIGVAGLTRSVVGVGTENGIDYIDMRWVGTPSVNGTPSLDFEGTTVMVAAVTQVWTLSSFLKMVAGTAPVSPGFTMTVLERDAGGALLGSSNTGLIATSAWQRGAHTRTLNQGTTAFVSSRLAFSVLQDVAVDFTVRIGLPQLEQGAFASSPIRTTGAAFTRQADIIPLTTAMLAAMASTTGTLFGRFRRDAAVSGTEFPRIVDSYGASNAVNVHNMFLVNSGTPRARQNDTDAGGITQAVETTGLGFSLGVASRLAMGWDTGAITITLNGQNQASNSTARTQAIPTQGWIGNRTGGDRALNGYLERLAFIPTRLISTDIQALSLNG